MIRAIFIAGIKAEPRLHTIFKTQRLNALHAFTAGRKVNHRNGIIFLQRGVRLGVVA